MTRPRSEDRIPSPEWLRQAIRYEPETGRFFWLPRSPLIPQDASRVRGWNVSHAGKEAFLTSNRGYRMSRIGDMNFFAHRVAWAIHHGRWPTGEIDHINGVKADNRIANLRDVTRKENCRNQRFHCNNTSGINGVSFHRATQKWSAYIRTDDGLRHLGLFPSVARAAAARRAAEQTHGYHPNHGTIAAINLIEREGS